MMSITKHILEKLSTVALSRYLERFLSYGAWLTDEMSRQYA